MRMQIRRQNGRREPRERQLRRIAQLYDTERLNQALTWHFHPSLLRPGASRRPARLPTRHPDPDRNPSTERAIDVEQSQPHAAFARAARRCVHRGQHLATSAVAPARASRRPRRPTREHDARRHPGGRVLLAPEPRGSGSAGVSRGRERVHRRHDAADGAAAGAVVPGDARPHPGDRPLGAGAAGRLALLSPHGGRRAVPDLLSPSGGGRGRRGGHPRPQPARERPRLLPARRLGREPRPPAAGVHGGHQRCGGLHAVREGALHRHAAGGDDDERLAQPGVGQRQPHAVLRRARRRAPPLPAPPPLAGIQPRRGRAGALRGR